MRTAFEQNVLDGTWQKWLDHRASRNITSHTYNADKAGEVAMTIPAFLQDAKALPEALELRAGS